MWTALLAGIGAIGVAPPPSPEAPSTPATDYARDIRPILAANCFKCHGPDEEARQAELRLDTRDGATQLNLIGRAAIVPGDARASLLIARISTPVAEDRMPPPEVSRHGLSQTDIGALERWIQAGAEYGVHWAFRQPVTHQPPRLSKDTWCRNAVDTWVLARLEREGLEPSPEAERATLLRRLSLDLTGLPPSPDDVIAFESDGSPDAYERQVDRLLESPAFGERWAAWWLDLARYADTKGYEADNRRTMWPYRDWVIRAFNRNMPFDRFTQEQLAGDMLPNPTEDNIIATAFHRNTMTNDEGGTDDEEFRTAAVIDRANTTAEIWLGLTLGCAQCHSHKFDPISHTDYYSFLSFFNNTEDADRPDEEPTLRVLAPEQRSDLEALTKDRADLERAIDEAILGKPNEPPTTVARAGSETVETLWVDDDLPLAAMPSVESLGEHWPWRRQTESPTPFSGVRCFGGTSLADGGAGPAQQFFVNARPYLWIEPGDVLIARVWIDPTNPPVRIVLQWHDEFGNWNHRAYWGDRATSIYGGVDGTAGLRRMGDLPTPGQWVTLESPATAVDLEGIGVDGWAFSQQGGTLYWDAAGVRASGPKDLSHFDSFEAWLRSVRTHEAGATPSRIRSLAAAPEPALNNGEMAELIRYFQLHVDRRMRARCRDLLDSLDAIELREQSILANAARLPVMRELPPDRARTTHRLERGSFLNPAEMVSEAVPAVFREQGPRPAPTSRLELASWLMSDANPLAGRSIVNRVWDQIFGIGITDTPEDLGAQGAWPSHLELLDHLSIEFRHSGWDFKQLVRTIVLSATYRQHSGASPQLVEKDPQNRLLARGPRRRLDGEQIRDLALAASGLLNPEMFGPPVFPPQPDGLWIMIYSGDRWATSAGSEKHRRALYTFWRRTVPYPSMTAFDAPSREFCISRRIRTNTPLQAFVTLNDPAFVECAQGLARRTLRRHPDGDDAIRAAFAFRCAVARAPTERELAVIRSALADARNAFRDDPAAARSAACDPIGPLSAPGPENSDELVEAAAWSVVCGMILNLDETLTKE